MTHEEITNEAKQCSERARVIGDSLNNDVLKHGEVMILVEELMSIAARSAKLDSMNKQLILNELRIGLMI